MSDYLDRLLAGARRRVEEARRDEPTAALRDRAEGAPPPASLRAALLRDGVSVIAEIKRASPSRGALAPGLVAVEQARAYLGGGAAAISVLTEPEQFHGSLEDLRRVAELGVPTLRKDCIVDPHQVWEARVRGAAAVLVIVTALTDDELDALMAASRRAGLDALVEVHHEEDLDRALAAGARVVGVNARDLRTFEVDPDAFGRLRERIPEDVLTVAESGVRGPDDVRRYGGEGADAVLVGEALVAAPDPKEAVAGLVAGGRVGT